MLANSVERGWQVAGARKCEGPDLNEHHNQGDEDGDDEEWCAQTFHQLYRSMAALPAVRSFPFPIYGMVDGVGLGAGTTARQVSQRPAPLSGLTSVVESAPEGESGATSINTTNSVGPAV